MTQALTPPTGKLSWILPQVLKNTIFHLHVLGHVWGFATRATATFSGQNTTHQATRCRCGYHATPTRNLAVRGTGGYMSQKGALGDDGQEPLPDLHSCDTQPARRGCWWIRITQGHISSLHGSHGSLHTIGLHEANKFSPCKSA